MITKAAPKAAAIAAKPPMPIQAPAAIISGLRAKRAESPAGKKTNFMIYAPSGAGKTTQMATAVRPIFVDSFDPSGLDSVRQGIDEGWIVADHQWETPSEDVAQDWRRYEQTLRSRIRAGVFEEFGTYCLDSLPMLSTSIFEYGKENAPTGDPRSAYIPAQTALISLLRRVVTVPCDVIVTTLLYERVDQETQRTLAIEPLLIGKSQVATALFSEIYCLEVRKSLQADPDSGLKVGDPIRSLVTNNDGLIKAKSRLGNRGQIPLRVPCNLPKGYSFPASDVMGIKAIKKMAGLPYEDKPEIA